MNAIYSLMAIFQNFISTLTYEFLIMFIISSLLLYYFKVYSVNAELKLWKFTQIQAITDSDTHVYGIGT